MLLAQVTNAGISGDKAIGSMEKRLAKLLKEASEQDYKYDFIIIMGGINDLFGGASAADTFGALVRMWEAAVAHKAIVLAATLMETGVPKVEQRRQEVNKEIRAYASLGAHKQVGHLHVRT